MVDALKRKLRIPARFVPYLEKHRIYELLNEVATALVMEQPSDHIVFMKNKLTELMISKDHPRILLLGPPHFDLSRLALLIANVTGSLRIGLSDVLACVGSQGDGLGSASPGDLARHTVNIIKTQSQDKHGWILHDFPRTRKEAVALQRAGIMPTHTFQLIPSSLIETVPFCSPLSTLSPSRVEIRNGIMEYRRQLLGLRDAFHATLQEVHVAERDIEEVAKVCGELSQARKHCGAPGLPRVLMVGPFGSGAKVQAKLLTKRFNIVYVCFEDVMEKAKLEDSELGKKLQLYISHNVDITNNMMASVIEKRLLERDCLDHGWVLTGYPKNVDQFKALDLIDTPPNRVIFLEVDPNICLTRLALRRHNVYTGSRHHLATDPPMGKSQKQMATHPKDYMSNVTKQLKCYQETLADMLDYSAGTETAVDASWPVATVFERVEAAVMRPPRALPPRNPDRVLAGLAKGPDLISSEPAPSTGGGGDATRDHEEAGPGAHEEAAQVRVEQESPLPATRVPFPRVDINTDASLEPVSIVRGTPHERYDCDRRGWRVDSEPAPEREQDGQTGPDQPPDTDDNAIEETRSETELDEQERSSQLLTEAAELDDFPTPKSDGTEKEDIKNDNSWISDMNVYSSDIAKTEEQYVQKEQTLIVNPVIAQYNMMNAALAEEYQLLSSKIRSHLDNTNAVCETNEEGALADVEQKSGGKAGYMHYGSLTRSRISITTTLETVKEEDDGNDGSSNGEQKKH